eukprot:g28709.t1
MSDDKDAVEIIDPEVQQRWNEDLHAIEESIKLMLTNHLQEAEDTKLDGSIFLAGMADDGKDSNSGAWARVPTWDGSPQTWRSFRKEMNWWLAGLDLQSTKKYNLAARWLLRQSGVVRQRGEEYEPHELAYQQEVRMPNPTTGDEEVVTPEDPLSGINKLLRSLEEMTGRTSLDKRGELRNVFYLELRRKSGERISEFATRYRSLVAELKIEGVVIGDGELGWWFKHKLGLDPLSAQLLETALAGAEDYPTIEREVLRLFKDLHVADPLHRRGGEGEQRAPLLNRFLSQQATTSRASSYAPSMASSTGRSLRSGSSTASSGRFNSSSAYRKPFVQKQVMVSEAEEDEMAAEIAQEAHEPDPEGDSPSLEEVLTTEAEVLAAELDEAAANGVDDDTLRKIEDSVEAAAEAFLTMKEARTKLQEVRKDRGYGKAPNPTATSPTSKVNLKKQSDRHPCFDCGLPGHWAGDAECQKPGQQLGRKKGKATLKQVKVTEALNTEHEEVATDGHEVLMVQRQPYLRFLPLPYPSTGTADMWLRQGQQQVKDGHGCRKHLDMAYTMDRFTYQNLSECIHWRNRLGLQTSFCEDPIVMGMIHGKMAKGLQNKVKNAALLEAQQEAREAEAAGTKEEQARALIGPRGGLPPLRGDLIKLATLLNVDVKADDNVETTKNKVRPIVNLLKESVASGKAKAKVKPAPKKAQGWTVGYAAGIKTEPSPGMVSYQHLIDMRDRFQHTLDNMALEIQELRNQQGQAVTVDLTSLGSASAMSAQDAVDPELLQDAAWSLEGAYEQQLMAQYGDNIEWLTREERQAVLDP